MQKNKKANRTLSFNFSSFVEILKHEKSTFFIGCIIGFVFFFGIYGYSRVIPWNDEWLMAGGDLTQHYLGWIAYRESPWSFPFCLTNKLSYPITTSVMFTDSIPLWAILFKILSPLLPSTFQYFGLFGLVTYSLQGGFAALLLRKLKCSLPTCFAGAAILTFMPTIMWRMFAHTALGSQWIILAALCLWFTDDKKFKHKYSYNILWCVLAFASVGIHLYLSAMVCIVLLGYCISLVIKRTNKKTVAARFGFPVISIILAVLAFGGFTGSNNPGGGYPDLYTSNLTALFDSDGWSKFGWPDLASATVGQYEGFAYLGLGVIILALISLFSLAIRFEIRRINKTSESEGFEGSLALSFIKAHPNSVSLAIVAIISILIGMGSTVTCLDEKLFSYPLPEFVLMIGSVFRAIGRFTWVAMYVITVASIVTIERNYKLIGKCLIIFALLIQLIDLYPFSRISHETADYESPLSSPVWDEFSGYSHIYMDEVTRNKLQFAITKYAFDNNATVNTFYFARPPKDMPYPLEMSDDTLYIFSSSFGAIEMSEVYEIDGLFVSASADTKGNFFQVMASFPESKVQSMILYPSTIGMNIQNATISDDGALYTDGSDAIVLYGPYSSVKAGTYDFTLNYEVIENINSTPTVGVFDICMQNGSNILQSVEIPADQTSLTISGITFSDLSASFESRVHNKNGAKLKIKSIEITLSDG